MNILGKKENPEEVKQAIESDLTNLRLALDAIAEKLKVVGKSAEHYKPKEWRLYNSTQVVNAIDSVLFSKAYIGKLVGDLGIPTPYQNDGKRKELKDIEPAAHKHPHPIQQTFIELNYIEKIDTLREEIEVQCANIMKVKQNAGQVFSYMGNIYSTAAFERLTDAKIWLGFELGRLRDN